MKRHHRNERSHYQSHQKRPHVGDNIRTRDGVCKQLRVDPVTQFSGSFPFFRQPKEVGTFSHDIERKFVHSNEQLRYFAPPAHDDDVHFDLSHGYRDANMRDDSIKEYLDDLLRWLLLNNSKFQLSSASGIESESLNTDFICWRGLLTKVLCTPYENREGWQISVVRHKGTWYMCEYPTEQRQQQKAQQTDKEKLMTFWGYKFEQYTTSDTNGGKCDTSSPVDTHPDYGSVVRSRLKEHSLVYGGEVDCCEKDDSGMKYVELKTSRELYNPNNKRNFKRFKLIKWWAQSFLLGVPKIVAGFRDDNGIVHRLETFKTLEIPKMIRDIREPWDPAVCFNFLDKFLELVKKSVTEDNHRVPYLFTWNPHEPVRCERCAPDSEFSFLPAWYTDPSTGTSVPT